MPLCSRQINAHFPSSSRPVVLAKNGHSIRPSTSTVGHWLMTHAGKDVGQRKFDKTFINARPLANNHAEEEVDLSFAGCGCSPVIKLNGAWQIELLEQRPACIVETIPLVAAIFWDPNFVPCSRHTLNLAKKIDLKTRNLSSALVKERIQ